MPLEGLYKGNKMQRYIAHKKLYIGQLVVVTAAKDAQVYTIAHINHENRTVHLYWVEGNNMCGSSHDYFSLFKPTLEQIETSIAINGRLVSTKDFR
jgi:uncharacterized protein YigE (DUF2233 family)